MGTPLQRAYHFLNLLLHLKYTRQCKMGPICATIYEMYHREKDNGLLKDLSGEQFGKLTILTLAPIEEWRFDRPHWICECECGNVIVRSGVSLRQGKRENKSCGCYKTNFKHGMSNAPEWNSWKGMKKRCTNKNCRQYPWYGGRGIKVSPAFESFLDFYAYMGPKPSPDHSLDRIDNNGDYEPGNVRWATAKEQNNNQQRFTT